MSLKTADVVVVRKPQVVTIRRKRSRRDVQKRRSLLNLVRDYQMQARRNSTREVALLILITLAGLAWLAIHTLQLLAELI
jgi:hypothetical protein